MDYKLHSEMEKCIRFFFAAATGIHIFPFRFAFLPLMFSLLSYYTHTYLCWCCPFVGSIQIRCGMSLCNITLIWKITANSEMKKKNEWNDLYFNFCRWLSLFKFQMIWKKWKIIIISISFSFQFFLSDYYYLIYRNIFFSFDEIW